MSEGSLINLLLDSKSYLNRVSQDNFFSEIGRVTRSVGLTFEGFLPSARLGSVVTIVSDLHAPVDAEVIGFRDRRAILMAIDDSRGVNTSSKIVLKQSEPTVQVGPTLIGRVIDAKGDPLDDLGPIFAYPRDAERRSVYGTSANPLKRKRIEVPLDLGVRAMNGLLVCGQGQRLGIMAGSGVGKSTLLGMMARQTKADVNVIALIGERGREVGEFIERDLGSDGLRRSVVVVATGEKSPLLRMRGAFMATAVAEYFSDMGANVLLMMDSVTRFCMAQREIGLSLGEPPASKGYTPSVFATLPKLLERAGTWTGKGSITGIYTVLVDGDDMDEPIADASRAILDGHIVLSRTLANRNHYPPIDVLQSVSRCMSAVVSKEHSLIANEIRDLLAQYQSNEDLINIGAYVKGTNPRLDQAVNSIERIKAFLKQGVLEKSGIEDSLNMMKSILGKGP